MRVIDFRHPRGDAACIDYELDALLKSVDGRARHRFTNAKVIDDDMHLLNANGPARVV